MAHIWHPCTEFLGGKLEDGESWHNLVAIVEYAHEVCERRPQDPEVNQLPVLTALVVCGLKEWESLRQEGNRFDSYQCAVKEVTLGQAGPGGSP